LLKRISSGQLKARDGYQQEARSFALLKQAFDLISPHVVKVIGRLDLSREKANSLGFHCGVAGAYRDDFGHWLARLGDNNGLPPRGLADQAAKVGFGIVNINRAGQTTPRT
jgi:hypothetical protein